MEPLPEVRAVADQLAALGDEALDLAQGLETVSALVVALLPSCVGVSITVVVDGDPFTVTATSDDMSALDGVQYLEGGPCLDAAAGPGQVRVADVLDEQRWQSFAQAAAAVGVRSTLSLPLRSGSGDPMGALNLYAADPDAFHGRQEQLADLFGVHVNELVANADLAFTTRDSARELPQRLADHVQSNQAVGVLMVLHGWSAAEARERLDHAALRAGTTRSSVARIIMMLDT
jgi:GAF domain-containing protein